MKLRASAPLALAIVAASATPALAYNVRVTGNGSPLRWAAGLVSVEIAMSDVPAGVSVENAEAAALAAFGTYQGLLAGMSPDVSIHVAMDGDAAPAARDDGQNVVRWVNSGWADSYDPGALAVTLTSYDTSTGRITDADIVVNAENYPWTASSDDADCQGAYDLQNVLTHEVGHFFGLAHDQDDREATMYPSSGMCETKKRDLDSDDMDSLTHLYVDTIAPSTTDGAAALGCSTSGQKPASLAGLLLIGGLFAFARRPRAAAALLVGLFAAVFAAAPAGATTVRQLSLDDMSADAVVVVRGVVGGVGGVRIGGHIYTDATLAVSECLKGPCGPTLTVRQLGGEVEGFGMHVEGSAELQPGSEVVLLLRRRLDGAYAPLGMAQGAFRVERDGKRGEIRALVRNVGSLRFAGVVTTSPAPTAAPADRITMAELRAAVAHRRATVGVR